MALNQFIIRTSVAMTLLVMVRGQKLKCGMHRATIRGRCYEEEVLVDNVSFAENLVVDRHTNVLYFIDYHSPNGRARYLDLNTKEFGAIAQVPDATAFAVDQDRHEVYVAGNNEIYKFHYNNKTIERVGSSGRYVVHSMCYKDQLYYTNANVYTMLNGESAEVEDMRGKVAMSYLVDEDGYQFFSAHGELYGKNNGSETLDLYNRKSLTAAVAIDSSGMPYTCKIKDLYFVNKYRKELQKIGRLKLFDYCTGLAFDKDNNIIYSNAYNIKILKALNLPVAKNNDE